MAHPPCAGLSPTILALVGCYAKYIIVEAISLLNECRLSIMPPCPTTPSGASDFCCTTLRG